MTTKDNMTGLVEAAFQSVVADYSDWDQEWLRRVITDYLSALSRISPVPDREAVITECASIAAAAQGLHVTTELIHGMDPGNPEREFWRGFAAAKEEIEASLRAALTKAKT